MGGKRWISRRQYLAIEERMRELRIPPSEKFDRLTAIVGRRVTLIGQLDHAEAETVLTRLGGDADQPALPGTENLT